ncbi:hypothetical protein ECG_06406 [Echinococcus granulosus]|nr:hypothetical protein ECG_06406 [Echinococcus granulosus]
MALKLKRGKICINAKKEELMVMSISEIISELLKAVKERRDVDLNNCPPSTSRHPLAKTEGKTSSFSQWDCCCGCDV